MKKHYSIKQTTTALFLIICFLLVGHNSFSQTSRVIFYDDFENPSVITANWGPATNYSIVPGFSGNGLTVSGTSSLSMAMFSKTIPVDSIRGRTISISGMIRAQNVKSNCWCTGIKLFIELTDNTGQTIYAQVVSDTGTYNWRDEGQYFVIDTNIVQAKLTIGLSQASGDMWFDNVKIELVDNVKSMPPARSPSIPIDKCHNLGMLRGMSISPLPKYDLDDLSYNWQADLIRWCFAVKFSDPKYDSILAAKLIQLDSAIKWCNANKLKIIVSLHPTESLFSTKAVQKKFRDTWKQIATTYKDSILFGYDLTNEPFYYNATWPNDGYLLYNDLMDTLVREIRQIDPTRPIIIETMNSNLSFTGFRRTDSFENFRLIDFSIPNIIYSFHFYDPYYFSHQGVYGLPIKYAYPDTIGGKYYDKSVLKSIMQPIKDFQEKYRVPVFVGEFSALRWALKNGAYNYIRDCIEIFEEFKWDWTYNTFRAYDGWSVECGTDQADPYPTAEPTDREDLMRRYFAKKEVGITTNYFNNANYAVYPNPVKNILTIKATKLNANSTLTIYNMNGLEVYKQQIKDIDTKIDISHFTSGIFLLKFVGDNRVEVRKVIKD